MEAIENENVPNDYAEVRNLLRQYYSRAARKYGTSFDYNSQKINEALKNTPFDDGTEVSVNRNEGIVGDLFENDILLTLPQAKVILQEIKSKQKRQAIRAKEYFWPTTTIFYTFGISDARWQNIIKLGLKHIESKTCMRFKEGIAREGIFFTRGHGCWSAVGRIGGQQVISIGYGCDSIGIIIHEVLHALGLWHEQSRTDRDNFVQIIFRNIYQGTQGNFEKRSVYNTDNMNQPYDLGSIMHYGPKAFTFDYSR
ncbi:unnamed protein product [Dracunculus medinensis]|uniref:Metalloendopeptidase n=1 Tax=Dracunculus medinensis TaxID=318479 RepID=A0A158Q4I2_DRAME|nr:unnamed protein product [Dracunculus medinensis]